MLCPSIAFPPGSSFWRRQLLTQGTWALHRCGLAPLWVSPQQGTTPLSLSAHRGACRDWLRQGECPCFWKGHAVPACSQCKQCFFASMGWGDPLLQTPACPLSCQNLLHTKQPIKATTHLPNPPLKSINKCSRASFQFPKQDLNRDVMF